ncbi:tail fiber domain-containing protein, partial [Aurantimonas marianensis]
MKAFVFFIAALLWVIPHTSQAACLGPTAAEGSIVYNGVHKVAQFCNGTDWVGMAGGTTSIMENDTIIDGWPDAIVCNVTSPNWGKIILPLINAAYPADGNFYYRFNDDSSSLNSNVIYGSDGSFSGYSGAFTTTDCNKNISDLYADGQAFNFVGGQPSQADTLSSLNCSDSQIAAWNDTTSSWGCTDAPTGGVDSATGMIAAFSASSCPAGWTEYTAARGRFLRGIDPTGTIDPDGVRTAGSVQADAFQSHTHDIEGQSGGVNNIVAFQDSNPDSTYSGGAGTSRGDSYISVGNPNSGRVSVETRPKNIAVIFCEYTGAGGLGGGGAADNLGDHTATQNIDLGSNALVGEGGMAGVYVDAEGSVGIGTTEPGGVLDLTENGNLVRISKNAGSPRITFRHADFATRWTIDVFRSPTAENPTPSDADFRIFSSNSDDGVGGDVRLTVTSTGDVGIGENATSPRQELHVANGNEAGGGNQTVAQFGTGSGSLFLTHNAPYISGNLRYDDGNWRYEADGNGNAIGFWGGGISFYTTESGIAGEIASSMSRRIAIFSDGHVVMTGSIGAQPTLTVEPTSGITSLTGWPTGWGGGIHTFDLYAEGSVALGTNGNQVIALNKNGSASKPGGGDWAASSDERLKDIDGVYKSGLDEIVRLKPKRFHYKADNPRGEPSDREFIGLVAQEAQE